MGMLGENELMDFTDHSPHIFESCQRGDVFGATSCELEFRTLPMRLQLHVSLMLQSRTHLEAVQIPWEIRE
jgi:hypothetical protein